MNPQQLDVRSGRYLARIWNRTEFRGEAVTLDQLTEACRRHFFSGRPCVGYPEDEDEQAMHEFLVSQTPGTIFSDFEGFSLWWLTGLGL